MFILPINTNDTIPIQKYTLQDFCELTERGTGLFVGQLSNSRAGWKKLADMWAKLATEYHIDIMEDAAYWIKWDIAPVWRSPAYIDLVRAVCDALLSDGPAYDTWIHHDYCVRTISDVADEFNPWIQGIGAYSYSDWHYRYIKCRMYLRIYNYRKGHVTQCKEFTSFVRFFEARIIKLLPDAVLWPDEYWLKEKYIFDKLAEICSYDYRRDLSSYHALLILTTSPKRMPTNRDFDIVQCAANIKQLPTQWTTALWPKKTDAIISQLFLLAADRANEVFDNPLSKTMLGEDDPIPDVDYTMLAQSWLLKYVTDLLANQKLPAATSKQVKQAIFNVNMRC